jgi:phosphatidylglycerol:prolipoprotein diacylglycerol transferase
MLPVIHFFGHTIAMYGLMIVLGAIAGVLTAISLGKRYSIKAEDILFSFLYGIIGLIAGAKILYLLIELPWIIENFELLVQNPDYIMSLLTGGFVFYGGLIGGLLMLICYCRKYKLKLYDMLPAIVPVIPLVHAFGRIGCFFAGCCYGIPYDGPFSITFRISDYAPNNQPLFPVQLAESTVNFIIFIILYIMSRKKIQARRILAVYMLMYSIMRFVLEFARGDTARGILLGLSTSQWFSIGLFACSIFLIAYKGKIKNKNI